MLTNAQSVYPKLDELHALVNTSSCRHFTQLICVTESWLSTKIPETATALDGFAQFRNDRSTESTNKTKGGGLLVYVNQEWSVNNNIIPYTRTVIKI